MSQSTFSGDFIDTALSQLGASKIKVVSGKQHVVDFELGNNTKLTYVFTITNENRCYLQRAQPYPIIQGRFASTEEILQFISQDLKDFMNASSSRNYEAFVSATRKTMTLTTRMEELFITRNLSPQDLAILDQEYDRLMEIMKEVESRSPMIPR